MDTSNWILYYNKNQDGPVRANLVYTPYVSPDGQTFCMSFNRHKEYHCFEEENNQWTDEDLQNRFEKEIEFYNKVHGYLPTLKWYDIDYKSREIFMEWPGEDFFMLGYDKDYDSILPSWKEQWHDIIIKLRSKNISKFSLHPNSFVVKDDVLIPFNWFFCYDRNDPTVTVKSVLKQISNTRLDKLIPLLSNLNIDIEKSYEAKDLEKLCLMSFMSNYPQDLIMSVMP